MLLFAVALGAAFVLRALRPRADRVRLSVRLVGLPIAAAVLQLALGVAPLHQLNKAGRDAVVLLSYALVGGWLIANTVKQARPLRVPGALLTIGWLFNAVAIVANHGMPVSRWALGEIGVRHPVVANGNLYKHVLAGSHVVVPWLGDVIPIAIPLARNVISIGDIAIFVGVLVMVRRIELSQAIPSPAIAVALHAPSPP